MHQDVVMRKTTNERAKCFVSFPVCYHIPLSCLAEADPNQRPANTSGLWSPERETFSSFRRLEFILTTNICLALTMTPFLLFLLWIWSRQCVTTSAVQSKKSPLLPIQIWTEATLQLYLEAMYDGNGIIN